MSHNALRFLGRIINFSYILVVASIKKLKNTIIHAKEYYNLYH